MKNGHKFQLHIRGNPVIVKHLLNTYFVQVMIFGLKHPKFVWIIVIVLKNLSTKTSKSYLLWFW